MKNKSTISAYLLLLLLVVALALPWISWMLAAFGFHCNSMLSDVGIRWTFVRLSDAIFTHHTILFLQFLITVGVLKRCGLFVRYSRLQVMPLMVAALIVLMSLVLIAFGAILSESPLLSITGTLFPSAWAYGMPSYLLLVVSFAAIVYGFLTQQVKSVVQLAETLTYGISHYAIFILMAMLVTYIYECITFIFY